MTTHRHHRFVDLMTEAGTRIDNTVEEMDKQFDALLKRVKDWEDETLALKAQVKRQDTEIANLRSQFNAFDVG